jgi:hypothetical protein
MYMRLSAAQREFGFASTEFVRLLVNYWGTKEAGRAFHVYIALILGEFGLVRSGHDPCLFTKIEPVSGRRVIVLLYVDDILTTGDWDSEREKMIVHLRCVFPEVKQEELANFVGMQISRDRTKKTISVTLEQYAKQIVAQHVPPHIGGSSTPLFSTVEYRGLQPGDLAPVWDITGQLRFISDSGWPELKVASSLLACAGKHPQQVHRKGAMKCLQYVKEFQDDHSLVLGGTDLIKQSGYSDSSYTPAGDSKYQYGFALYLGSESGAYTAESKRSTTVSHSSAQSEVKSMNETCKRISADRDLLAELGEAQLLPTSLYTDSQAGVDLISNVFQMYPKCRHFNRDICYVRECVQNGSVLLFHVRTDMNPADILTKVLAEEKHTRFTTMLLKGVGAVTVAAIAWCSMQLL